MLRSSLKTLIVALAAMLSSCGGEQVEPPPPVRPVQTIMVGGSLTGRLTFPGVVQAAKRAELSFRVAGPLVELPVNEGDYVEAGKMLAHIDPRDYNIAVTETRAQYDKSEADRRRYQNLYEQNAVPLSDLEYARAQRDVAKARFEQAQADLKDTYLRAPFDGRIGAKFVENFEIVKAQQRIMTLHNVEGIEIVVNVPEYLMALSNAGVTIESEASFDTWPGRNYPLVIKEQTAEADAQTRTYAVTFAMPQPEELVVLPGMNAKVILTPGQGAQGVRQVLTVPAQAVVANDEGDAIVWVLLDGGIVESRRVSIGEVTGTAGVRVLDGLNSGEEIIVTGLNHLQDGMQVRRMER